MWRLTRVFTLFAVLSLMTTQNATADWRSEIGVFRIGVVTADQANAFTRRAEPFRLALQDALKMDVEFFTARRPESIIDALSSDRIEYAILSATGYALAWSVCECIEPVASPRFGDGTDGYNLVLITRQDGPSTLNELSGRTVGLLSEKNALEVGIFKLALEKSGVVEEQVQFVNNSSGEATVQSFVDGNLDALLGWSSLSGNPSIGYSRGTLLMLARITGDLATKFPLIWKSEQLAHRVHSVQKKLPGEAKNALRNALISMYDRDSIAYDSIEPVYGGGFTTARHSSYQPFIDVIEVFKSDSNVGSEAEQNASSPEQDEQSSQ